MNARYIRVSTASQNIDRQLTHEELLFIDVSSGSVPFNKRPKAIEFISKLDAISYLSVSSIDRLGRNLVDILNTIELLNTNNVVLKVDNLGIESLVNGKPNAAFKLIISVMANIAEMERETMLDRQKQGIAIAKAKGVYKGRLKGSKTTNEAFLTKYKNVVKYLNLNYSLRNTAKLCDVSLSTVQRVKEIKNN